jgi:3',5'-cyclic-AMP phosphodiesterase
MATQPLRIAHLGSLHCGEATFSHELAASVAAAVNRCSPDLVVVAGDLTAAGYGREFEQASAWIDRIEAPTVVVPGNHDSRNVGYVHFTDRFGERFARRRMELDPARAARLLVPGVTILGLDSTQPDLDEGHVGREWYRWILEQLRHPADFKIVTLHHQLVPVPGSGLELGVVNDAGDLLHVLARAQVDVVLTGHRHVPGFWSLNGMLLCNCSTATTTRVRGLVPPSWNELRVDASTVKVVMHYPDGRAELAAIHSRNTRDLVREAFFLTEEFRDLNQLDQALGDIWPAGGSAAGTGAARIPPRAAVRE